MQPRTIPTHDRHSFFKYISAATAAIVLQNRALRWSSPLLFNDPFDVPREMSFGVTPREIVDAVSRRLMTLFDNPPEDTSLLEPKLRMIAEAIKRGIPPDVKAELIAGIRESAAQLEPTSHSMDQMRDMWRAWIPQMRILCLTESPNHTAMWFHYADKYKGAVLEFRCVSESDSPWLIAKPIAYPAEKPEVYTAEGWAALLAMPKELAIRRMLDVAAYTKAPDWSYEKEWRVMTFKRPTDTGNFTDYKFDQRELAGLYLGPLITQEDRSTLLHLVAAYPSARVFNVSVGMSRELIFEEHKVNSNSSRPPPVAAE